MIIENTDISCNWTDLTSRANRITPASSGADALVPVKFLTHSLLGNVVAYNILYFMWFRL